MSISRLSDEQDLFWRVITWPTGVADFLAQADEDTRAAFAATFEGNDSMDAVARMTVYAESYFWRLAEVLSEQYRVLTWLLGPTCFHNLVTDFVLHRPSKSPDVRRFGARLPDYLAEHAIEQEHGGLAALARIERAIVRAIDIPDQSMIDRQALAAVPLEHWPTMRLRVADHVQVLTAPRSYPRAWAAWNAKEPSPESIPPMEPDATYWVLVWRRAAEVFHRGIAAGQAAALRAAAEGAAFEPLCEAAQLAQPGLEPAQIVAWLGQWLDDGLLCGLEHESATASATT